MNITFLVGNGFDLNLGLKTKYCDFLDYYSHPDRMQTELIEEFVDEILQETTI